MCVRKLEIPIRMLPRVYYSGNASRWRERSEYAERYWNLPVVLRCPKTGSFLEYLEMGPAWVIFFQKTVYFKILSNLLFKILFQFIFKDMVLKKKETKKKKKGICLMYFYVYTKQLNKSCFDRIFFNYQNQRVKEKSHERNWELNLERSRFVPYFMDAKQKRVRKYQ